VQEYAQVNNLVLGDQFGSGVHGIVFAAQGQKEAVGSALNEDEPLITQAKMIWMPP
jgi:hypothetical protein